MQQVKTMNQEQNNNQVAAEEKRPQENSVGYFKIQFRPEKQLFSASTRLQGLQKNDVVMVQAEHGLERPDSIDRESTV